MATLVAVGALGAAVVLCGAPLFVVMIAAVGATAHPGFGSAALALFDAGTGDLVPAIAAVPLVLYMRCVLLAAAPPRRPITPVELVAAAALGAIVIVLFGARFGTFAIACWTLPAAGSRHTSAAVAVAWLAVAAWLIAGAGLGLTIVEVAAAEAVLVAAVTVATRRITLRGLWRASRPAMAWAGALLAIALASPGFASYVIAPLDAHLSSRVR